MFITFLTEIRMHDVMTWGRDAAFCIYLKIQQNGDSFLTGAFKDESSIFLSH